MKGIAQRIDHELTEAEAAVLMAATKDAMGAAGALGGSLGSPLGHEGVAARGGAAGGRFGARFTRPRSAAARIEVAREPAAVRELARSALGEGGRVVDDPNGAGDGSIWGIVGSGALNMSPALVRVDVEPADAGAGGSRVAVLATGREGLIKQAIAAKAVDRICAAIGLGAS